MPSPGLPPAEWTPGRLERLVAALSAAEDDLRTLSSAGLLAAWSATVEAFLNPGSPERRALDPPLARNCRLSPAGLAAGLEAVLGGVRSGPAAALLAEADELRRPVSEGLGPVLVVLASNLPALAVQPLWPALALRRPVLLKSPSTEPLFAASFLQALARREPRLARAAAAAAWPGGEERLEAPVLEGSSVVIAYGDEPALADLERRAPGKVVGYGPKTSLGVVGEGADLQQAAAGLARDVALFDQRGCLSVAAVYAAAGAAQELAVRLARELTELGRRWPPGPPEVVSVSAVQHLRLEAEMRGLRWLGSSFIPDGTVLLDPEPAFRPSPGLRAVRVHPLADLGLLPGILSPWRGRLQGAALAGEGAWRLAPALADLGVSRLALAGDLQSPDVTWHNGGVHPLRALRAQ